MPLKVPCTAYEEKEMSIGNAVLFPFSHSCMALEVMSAIMCMSCTNKIANIKRVTIFVEYLMTTFVTIFFYR